MVLPDPLSETASRSLRRVLGAGTATRPELATALGVTKQTVSHAVAELEERRLVAVAAVDRGGVGRTALRYGLHPAAGWVAGIDLGASRTRVAAARLDGRIVARRDAAAPRATVLRDLPDQLARAALLLAALAQDLSETDGGLLGAVVAVPRAVPTVRDLIRDRLEGADEQLLAAMQAVAPAALWTENDVNCGALAQLGSPPASTVLYLHAGIGLGTALIVRGRVVRGSRGRAGEIAGLPAPGDDGRTAEQALGAEGLLAAAGHSVTAPLVGALDDLFAAAALGDAAAEAALSGEATGLGALVQQLAAFVDPDRVVLSGVIGGRADLLPRVAAECARRSVGAPVVVDPLGESATVTGAAGLAARLVLDALAPAR